MSISTKLLLLLTISVGLVMLGASLWVLRQYEFALENTLREDLEAHAVTLQLALEENYGNENLVKAQRLIDRLRENTEIHAVILFDNQQNLLAESKPLKESPLRRPAKLKDVLVTGKTFKNITEIDGEKYASVLIALRRNTEIIGAFEIVKPLSLIKKDVYNARIYWILTTFLLLFVIATVAYVVLYRNLSVPIQTLFSATEAVAKGDFDHQVILKSQGNEFSILANQFNQMAQSLREKDITTKLEIENRIRLEREVRHNEQLVMVGRMAAGVAHELGAPLNVIDARAEQLQKNLNITPQKHERNLEIIRSNVARITHLVRLLLNLARPFNFNLSAVNIQESLDTACEQIESMAESAQVQVELQVIENVLVNADPNYLHQVWINILLNALQEMPDGGKLSIKVRTKEDFALIAISDTGNGILQEHFISLFDPFFTTKDIGKGTGLGLPIANRIVEEHGGIILAENNADGGATFTVKLPLMKLNSDEE